VALCTTSSDKLEGICGHRPLFCSCRSEHWTEQLQHVTLACIVEFGNSVVHPTGDARAAVLGKNIWPKVFETKAGLLDVSLMTAGVLFAAIAALAESESQQPRNHESHILLGVMMCFLSDIAAAMTLILASAFTSALDPPLGPMDTIFYMALPCALILLPASMYAVHPVNWPGFGPLTDWQVMSEVMSLSPYVALYVVASGVISAGYNFIQYTVVQSLSANHAAFAGNFNKAATISLSICFGLEVLPGGMWSPVMLLGIVGNICSFTVWSYLQSGGARPPKPA